MLELLRLDRLLRVRRPVLVARSGRSFGSAEQDQDRSQQANKGTAAHRAAPAVKFSKVLPLHGFPRPY